VHPLPAGVTDALAKGYLKSMFFGISEDPEGTELLEVGCWAHGGELCMAVCLQAGGECVRAGWVHVCSHVCLLAGAAAGLNTHPQSPQPDLPS
jgi:hypothetical protein